MSRAADLPRLRAAVDSARRIAENAKEAHENAKEDWYRAEDELHAALEAEGICTEWKCDEPRYPGRGLCETHLEASR